MNYLELCNAFRDEAGISGSDMVTVSSQTGLNKLVTSWIKRAWIEVQAKHDNWNFMMSEKQSRTLTNGLNEYTAAALTISDFGAWDINSFRIHDSTIGLSDQGFLIYVPWDEYRSNYDVGSLQTGKPQYFSVVPNGSVAFYPVPDSGNYDITFRYYTAPVSLSVTTDTPSCPAQFHDVIIYKALMYYGVHDDAPEIVIDADRQYRNWIDRLERHQLPATSFAAPALGEEPLA